MSSNERGESQEIAQVSGKAPCPRAFFREPLAHDSPNTELVPSYFASDFILSWKSNCFYRLFAIVPITRSNYFLVYFTTQFKSRLPVSLFFVFWGVQRRRHCFCSMITWKFNSSAQLNVVTKSLLMSCKGRCKLQVEIFIFITSPRLIRILALSRVRSRQRDITWRNWQYCWAWKGKRQKKKLRFDPRRIFRQLCVEY